MIRTILVDDQPNNTLYVKELLQLHFHNIEVVSICNEATVAISLIRKLQPQLVFMDIEMPGTNGFEVLRQLEPISFEVIFITAYSNYAIEAFDLNAVGYITKPIDVNKFIKTTNTAIHRIEQSSINQKLFSLLQTGLGNDHTQKIALPTQHGLQFLLQSDILYCQSSGNYTKFFTRDGKSILVSRQIGEFEKLLPGDDFQRIHDQYIVHLRFIKEYVRGRGGELIMENNTHLPVSANRKEAFLHRFEKWFRKS